jgi:hypothetical protein
MKCAVELGSDGMTDVPSSMTIHQPLSLIAVITATIWEPVMLVLLTEGIYGACLLDGVMWHDIRTKIRENWCRRSSNIKVCVRNLRSWNAGIADGRDLWITPLKWGQGAMIQTPSFIHIGSVIHRLIWGIAHIQTGRCSHEPTFYFFNVMKVG